MLRRSMTFQATHKTAKTILSSVNQFHFTNGPKSNSSRFTWHSSLILTSNSSYIHIIKQISLSMTFGLTSSLYWVDCILSNECPQTEDVCLWAHKVYIYQSKQPKKQIFSGVSKFYCRYNTYTLNRDISQSFWIWYSATYKSKYRYWLVEKT